MFYGDIGGAELVSFQHALIAKKFGADIFILCPSKGVNFDKFLKHNINIIHCPELLTEKAGICLDKHLKDVDVVYNCNYFIANRGYIGSRWHPPHDNRRIIHSMVRSAAI